MQMHPITVIGNDGNKDQRTIFQNFDTKLKKKFQSIPWPETFREFNPTTWNKDVWSVGEVEGDTTRCTCGNNVSYVRNDDLKQRLNDLRLSRMNAKYNPASHFIKQHGTLYLRKRHYQKSDVKYHVDEVQALVKGKAPKPSGANMSHFEIEEFKYNRYNSKIELVHSEGWGTACFFEFNENYDFINRDMNIKLQNYIQAMPDVSEIYDHLKQRFNNMETVKYNPESKDLILYTDQYCYLIYLNKFEGEVTFTMSEVPKRVGKNDYQLCQGEHIHKLPRTGLVEVNAAELFAEWEQSNKLLKRLKEKFHKHLILETV